MKHDASHLAVTCLVFCRVFVRCACECSPPPSLVLAERCTVRATRPPSRPGPPLVARRRPRPLQLRHSCLHRAGANPRTRYACRWLPLNHGTAHRRAPARLLRHSSEFRCRLDRRFRCWLCSRLDRRRVARRVARYIRGRTGRLFRRRVARYIRGRTGRLFQTFAAFRKLRPRQPDLVVVIEARPALPKPQLVAASWVEVTRKRDLTAREYAGGCHDGNIRGIL
jgi:hypothetical protein